MLIVPSYLKEIVRKFKEKSHEFVLLVMVFAAALVLAPICHYSRSSYLLGAFIAGLMFCTQTKVHIAWRNQIKRNMQLMVRIFFSATIGFHIPIQSFGDSSVIGRGFLYSIAIFGKLAMGLLAKPFSTPCVLEISFAMSSWVKRISLPSTLKPSQKATQKPINIGRICFYHRHGFFRR